jgi:enoyl-CoA hydratase/carnithine racemase
MKFNEYVDSFSCVAFHRHDDGVLEMRLHDNGGSFAYKHAHDDAQPGTQAELLAAFGAIAADPDNRVLLITGSGSQFSGPSATTEPFPRGDIGEWEQLRRNGEKFLMNYLDIDVPIVCCVNGPAVRHAEIALLADIVLASETATFQDTAHMLNRVVPGDGINIVLPLVLPYNRGRYHLLTGKPVTADEAFRFGLVAEVLAPDELLARGRELAHEIAANNALVLRYTKQLLNHPLKKLVRDSLGLGLALEALAAVDESNRTAS